MRILANIFGKSPFALLQTHMEKVHQCVEKLPTLFQILWKKEYEELTQLANTISKLEHESDLTKNDIRNHLPTSLFMPIERSSLLEILSLQDSIADKVEDIAVLLTFRKLPPYEPIHDLFQAFLDKNLETFREVHKIILEIDQLVEFSFGGVEAQKVSKMVELVAFKEHETDLLQRKILKSIFTSEQELPHTCFYLWQNIIKEVGNISNLSEKLANRIRMTLEIK